jgi:hypothetical protein
MLLGERQQEQIIAALTSARRPLIVINEQRLLSLPDSTVIGTGPLAHFIQDDCLEVTRLNGCRILAPARRAEDRVAGDTTGRFQRRTPGLSASGFD